MRRNRARQRLCAYTGNKLYRGPRSGAAMRLESRSRLVVVDDRLWVVEALEPVHPPRFEDLLAAHRLPLRQVAPHVLALGIEAPRLAHRVQHPVGPGVVAGPGHPLPVAGVVGDLAVAEQVPE